MERKSVKASELQVGMRYKYSGMDGSFIVVRSERDAIWVLFDDGQKGLYFNFYNIDVVEFPLSSLEKELF